MRKSKALEIKTGDLTYKVPCLQAHDYKLPFLDLNNYPQLVLGYICSRCGNAVMFNGFKHPVEAEPK